MAIDRDDAFDDANRQPGLFERPALFDVQLEAGVGFCARRASSSRAGLPPMRVMPSAFLIPLTTRSSSSEGNWPAMARLPDKLRPAPILLPRPTRLPAGVGGRPLYSACAPPRSPPTTRDRRRNCRRSGPSRYASRTGSAAPNHDRWYARSKRAKDVAGWIDAGGQAGLAHERHDAQASADVSLRVGDAAHAICEGSACWTAELAEAFDLRLRRD